MKNKIIIIIALFLITPCAHSQHVTKSMPVNIPLNSTKESAVQKLLNKGYWLCGSREEDGYNILEYMKDEKVSLWFKGNTISIVSWGLSGGLTRSGDAALIEKELKQVYGIEPYKCAYKESNYYPQIEQYYHWKGNTIILSIEEIYILSNADAEKRFEKKIQTPGWSAKNMSIYY